jgi:transposase
MLLVCNNLYINNANGESNMKRKDVLELIKVAGYHNDTKTHTRLYVENRISMSSANEYWSMGVQAKKNGIKCNCNSCHKQTQGE